MYYLVHTANQPRPYITVVSFIARDFQTWGYRVDRHDRDSAYIAEVKSREKHVSSSTGGIEIMQIWAKEVADRWRRGEIYGREGEMVGGEDLSGCEKREARVSSLVRDFVGGIDELDVPSAIGQRGLLPNSSTLASRYIRLLKLFKRYKNAQLPPWSDPEMSVADQVTLEFYQLDIVSRDHLVHAVAKAVNASPGRMGRVEMDVMMGVMRVALYVDVGDCLVTEGDQGPESMDPVPKYERVEQPPPYVDGGGSLTRGERLEGCRR